MVQIDDWFLDFLIEHEDDSDEFVRLCVCAGFTDIEDAQNQVADRKARRAST